MTTRVALVTGGRDYARQFAKHLLMPVIGLSQIVQTMAKIGKLNMALLWY